MGLLPRAQRTAIQREAVDATIKPDKRISQHLSVFNGVKGMAMVFMTWGITFYFVWFSIISNPEDVSTMSDTFMFNVVSMCVYTVPIFFFCSGFLQSFALIQSDKSGSAFTCKALTKWYFRKITRYMPLNIVAMLFTIFMIPMLGAGPIWNTFKTAT